MDDVTKFLSILNTAASNIDQPYFALPVAGQEHAMFRERVYAYELYHQLRTLWPPPSNDWEYVLNGEIDKKGHPLLRDDGVVNRVPDMLVHRPGDMGDNLVILEIKSVEAPVNEISEDLQKLQAFCEFAGYRRGVLLLFGDSRMPDALMKLRDQAVQRVMDSSRMDAIRIYWHPAACKELCEVPLSTTADESSQSDQTCGIPSLTRGSPISARCPVSNPHPSDVKTYTIDMRGRWLA